MLYFTFEKLFRNLKKYSFTQMRTRVQTGKENCNGLVNFRMFTDLINVQDKLFQLRQQVHNHIGYVFGIVRSDCCRFVHYEMFSLCL